MFLRYHVVWCYPNCLNSHSYNWRGQYKYDVSRVVFVRVEAHRTNTSYEDSYTFKMIVFQFLNFYGSIIYIAFFKGRSVFIGLVLVSCRGCDLSDVTVLVIVINYNVPRARSKRDWYNCVKNCKYVHFNGKKNSYTKQTEYANVHTTPHS